MVQMVEPGAVTVFGEQLNEVNRVLPEGARLNMIGLLTPFQEPVRVAVVAVAMVPAVAENVADD